MRKWENKILEYFWSKWHEHDSEQWRVFFKILPQTVRYDWAAFNQLGYLKKPNSRVNLSTPSITDISIGPQTYYFT